ncbi:TcfC E-set like domain-containing protein [Vibrio parahaemolyticus]|nr:TcfC E-set like domain-containing protein [Vibrio parahaemolyticus]EHR6924481.1 TcfC E-set like domain-containing protein [Vibrio parahaemolyticus]
MFIFAQFRHVLFVLSIFSVNVSSAELYKTLESRVYSEVFVLGKSIGYFDVDFIQNGERLKFEEISRLIKEINRTGNIKSISNLRENNINGFDYKVSKLSCTSENKKTNIIFHNENGSLDFCFPKDYFTLIDSKESEVYSSSSPALISNQILNVSHRDGGDSSISLNQKMALGLTKRNYLYSDLSINNSGLGSSSYLNEFYYSMSTSKIKSYIGRISLGEGSSSIQSGGLIRVSDINGIRFSNVKNVGSKNVVSSKFFIILNKPSTIQFYKGGRLIYTSYFDSGVNSVDTSSFPFGRYDVESKIYEKGKYVRSEVQSFYKLDSSLDKGEYGDFLFQAGMQDDHRIAQFGYENSIYNNISIGFLSQVSNDDNLMFQINSNATITDDDYHISYDAYSLFYDGKYSGYKVGVDLEYYGWSAYYDQQSSCRNNKQKDDYFYDIEYKCGKERKSINISKSYNGYNISVGYQKNDKDIKSNLSISSTFSYDNFQLVPRLSLYKQSFDYSSDVGFSFNMSMSLLSNDNTRLSGSLLYDENSFDADVFYESQFGDNKISLRGSSTRLSSGEVGYGMELGGETQGKLGKLALSGSLYKNGMQSTAIYGSYSSSMAISSKGVATSGYFSSLDQLSGVIINVKDSEYNKSNRIRYGEKGGAIVSASTGGKEYIYSNGLYYLPIKPNYKTKIRLNEDVGGTTYTYENLNEDRGIAIPFGRVVFSKIKTSNNYVLFGNLKELSDGQIVLDENETKILHNGDFSIELKHFPKKIYIISENNKLIQCEINDDIPEEIYLGVYSINGLLCESGNY